jgi:dTDP-4-dehydrorhamnose 3,5-epimerase
MKLIKNLINGSYLININKKIDNRGFFLRAYCSDILKKKKLKKISQINFSYSKKIGTIRGLHYQKKPFEETKIIYCLKGKIYDVVVDLRKKSKTYGKYYGVILSEKKRNGIVIPSGCAHGFQTLTNNVEIVYFSTQKYSSVHESGILYNDKIINIKWPLRPTIISKKDKSWKSL